MKYGLDACDNISRVTLIPLLKHCQTRWKSPTKLFDGNLFYKRLTIILIIIVRKAYFHFIAMRECTLYSVCLTSSHQHHYHHLLLLQLLTFTNSISLTHCTVILAVNVLHHAGCVVISFTPCKRRIQIRCVFGFFSHCT